MTSESRSRTPTHPPAPVKPARPDQRQASPAHDPLRPEDDDQDQDHAVDDVAVVADETKDLGQGGEEDGPYDGAEHVAGPSDHGEGEDLDGAADAVLGGVDEEVDVRLERSGVAGQDGADDESDHLVERNVDPVARGGQLILTNGGPGLAQPGAGQAPDEVAEHRNGNQDGHDPAQRVGGRVLEPLSLAGDR